MKKRMILLVLFLFIVIPSIDAGTLESCSIKQSCSSDETAIASVYDEKDAHISKDVNRFQYKLCCKGNDLGNSCDSQVSNDNLGYIYSEDEAHIDAQHQPHEICLSTTDNSNVECSIKKDCSNGEVCVFDMYQETDSHIAECGKINLPYSMCCEVTPPKTCYEHGEVRSDDSALQCCPSTPEGEPLYYSRASPTDIIGGCCIEIDEKWNLRGGFCERTGAIQCGLQCPYDSNEANYFTTEGCFFDFPPPLPYERSCCLKDQYGITDKFYDPIEVIMEDEECTGTKFCGINEKLCSSTPDGFCPEAYGDWSYCPLNEIGGECSPCDPDCGNCGSIRFVYFPRTTTQKEELIIKVEYNLPIEREITLWRVKPGSDNYIDTNTCVVEGDKCIAEFSKETVENTYQELTAPNQPGASYTYKANLAIAPDIIIKKTGNTLPLISILFPVDGASLIGSKSINVKAESQAGISNVNWLVEKRSSPEGTLPVTYSPVNVKSNLCTEFCEAEDCNLLGTISYNPNQDSRLVTPSKEFDTLTCDNNDFKLIATTQDFIGNGAEDSILVSTDNKNAPCGAGECPVYDSKLLKIVTAKVKTWV